jgi:hypothetical protein
MAVLTTEFGISDYQYGSRLAINGAIFRQPFSQLFLLKFLVQSGVCTLAAYDTLPDFEVKMLRKSTRDRRSDAQCRTNMTLAQESSPASRERSAQGGSSSNLYGAKIKALDKAGMPVLSSGFISTLYSAGRLQSARFITVPLSGFDPAYNRGDVHVSA